MYLFYLRCQFKDLNIYKLILIIEEYMYINAHMFMQQFLQNRIEKQI